MSKMGNELEKRLDENKYKLWELVIAYRTDLDTLLYFHPDDPILAIKMYEVVQVLAKIENNKGEE